MAKMLKCPRCQAQFDAGNLSPGSSARCAECGAMVRVPTGNTSVRTPAVVAPAPKVPEVVAPPPGRGRTERGTDVRRRREGTRGRQKSSSTGLIIGVSVGALVLVVVLIAVMAGGKSEPPPVEPARKPAARPVAGAPAPEPGTAPETPRPADAPPAPVARAPRDPAGAKWDDIMKNLRPGGGFDDPSRPEGVAFQMVKEMGKGAYPHLVRYIDNEDSMIGRAAVTVLNELTGQKKPLPNDATKVAQKAEWEAWLKTQ
jgi:hypothetical protein